MKDERGGDRRKGTVLPSGMPEIKRKLFDSPTRLEVFRYGTIIRKCTVGFRIGCYAISI